MWAASQEIQDISEARSNNKGRTCGRLPIDVQWKLWDAVRVLKTRHERNIDEYNHVT